MKKPVLFGPEKSLMLPYQHFLRDGGYEVGRCATEPWIGKGQALSSTLPVVAFEGR